MKRLAELGIARKQLIQDFKDEKHLLRLNFETKLNVIDKQISGLKKFNANNQSKKVKNIKHLTR